MRKPKTKALFLRKKKSQVATTYIFTNVITLGGIERAETNSI